MYRNLDIVNQNELAPSVSSEEVNASLVGGGVLAFVLLVPFCVVSGDAILYKWKDADTCALEGLFTAFGWVVMGTVLYGARHTENVSSCYSNAFDKAVDVVKKHPLILGSLFLLSTSSTGGIAAIFNDSETISGGQVFAAGALGGSFFLALAALFELYVLFCGRDDASLQSNSYQSFT